MHLASRWPRFFVRQGAFCRCVQAVPRGRSRLHSCKRRWPPEVLLLRRPPRGQKGEKNRVGCPRPSSDRVYMYWYKGHVSYTTSRRNGLIYSYTYTRSLPILHVYTAAACWIVGITADQYQSDPDFSYVRMLTMWLLRAYTTIIQSWY